MFSCEKCGKENSDGASLCLGCGNYIKQASGSGSGDGPDHSQVLKSALASDGPPKLHLMVPAKAYLMNRPLYTDWVFWLPVGFVCFRGIGIFYSEGAKGITQFLQMTRFELTSGIFDGLFLILTAYILLGLIPAWIRWPFRRRKFENRSAAPTDTAEGWKPDPHNLDRQRWWASTFWSRATRPQEDAKNVIYLGTIIGICVVMLFAFLIGAVNRGSDLNLGITNSDRGDTLDTMEATESENNFDEVLATSVADVYYRVNQEIEDYYAVQIDLENLIPAYIELGEIVNNLQTSQRELQGLVTASTTQEMLGGSSAPDVEALRDLTAALGSFVANRMNYYQEMEACEPLRAPGREYGICDDEAFTKWEARMAGDLGPMASSFQSVLDSLKSE